MLLIAKGIRAPSTKTGFLEEAVERAARLTLVLPPPPPLLASLEATNAVALGFAIFPASLRLEIRSMRRSLKEVLLSVLGCACLLEVYAYTFVISLESKWD